MRYCLEFAYFGKNFFGYQKQPNQITVQEVLEHALSTLLRTEIKIVGAGRTDTGVHAKKMFAHFDFDGILMDNLAHRLNTFLDKNIAVQRVFEVKSNFHARFDATFRTYEYIINEKKDPFSQDFSWQFYKDFLNVDLMNEACEILMQYQDFSSFAKLHAENKTNFCVIFEAFWVKEGNQLKFTIKADRFLRNMVRAIVGTMVEVGSGKIKPEAVHTIIQGKNRHFAGVSAPAQGLFLVEVGYDFS